MRTTPIPVTVGTFEARRQHEGPKSDDSYEDGGFAAPKTTTVTRMATLTGLIPVTVGTFQAYQGGGWQGGYHGGGGGGVRCNLCVTALTTVQTARQSGVSFTAEALECY